MKHLAAVMTLILPSVLGVMSFDRSAIKEFAVEHNHTALIEKLTALKSSDRKQFEQHDYDYLLAHAAEMEGMTALALVNYQAVAERDSVLNSYALAHLTHIARSSGNLLFEQIYLKELLTISRDESLRAAARYCLARNAFEAGSYKETIRFLANGSKKSDRSSIVDVREARALLGEAHRLSGDVEKATKILDEILQSTPKAEQPDDAALTAVRNLDAINGGDASLGEAEHWRRAYIYQFNRYFDEAKFHYETVFAVNRTGAKAADSLFQIGRGYAQKENFAEAIAWYERVIELFPESATAKDALLQVAAAYARVGKPKEATTRYQHFIDKYERDEKLDRAYLNIVDVLRDQGADTDALKWCAKTAEVFKGKTPEALALFAEARIYLSREDWPPALAALDRLRTFSDLGGANAPGGTSKPEVSFLRAFVLEQQNNFGDAIDAYLTIPDGRGEYYGWRATQNLKQLGSSDAAKSHIENKLARLSDGLKAKDADSRKRAAQNILRLTDGQEINERAMKVLKSELRNLPNYKLPTIDVSSPVAKSDAAKRLAELGLRDEAFPDRAVFDLAQVDAHWRKMPADFPLQLIPREHLGTLYPAPFADELLQHAATRGVDPRFVLAIMRQESRFQHDARSAAAARGLMQFIHTTTESVSNELGRSFFMDDEMYDPETSILYGSHYLSGLFAMFPEKGEAVAAAYNAGETNVKRWLARVNSSEPARYMPEFVFGQSKDYAAKVMTNYRMYQYLYDERLALRATSRSE